MSVSFHGDFLSDKTKLHDNKGTVLRVIVIL